MKADDISKKLLDLIKDTQRLIGGSQYDLDEVQTRIDNMKKLAEELEQSRCKHPVLAGGRCAICKAIPE